MRLSVIAGGEIQVQQRLCLPYLCGRASKSCSSDSLKVVRRTATTQSIFMLS